jgi:antirestriction protein ArdC
MQNTIERKDIYSRITAQIVEQLEKGVRPWVRPWNAEHAAGRITRPLRFNGQPYSGINILSLWMSALSQNFAAPIWMTYRQATDLNAHVRTGETGSLVVYANAMKRTEYDEKTGEDIEREIPYMKGYTVFNVEQIEGLPEIYYANAVPTLDPVARIEHAEKFFASIGATIRHAGNRAYYAQELDYVQMPPFESFRDAESYYSTLAHELTHWTKHEQRLDRDFGRKHWGDTGYASEELVAELGSAFLCADLELHQEPREDNAAYIANWLEVLKSDNRAIFAASAYAQRAADYLHKRAGRSLARWGGNSPGPPFPHPAHDIFTCQRSASGFNIDNMSSGYNHWITEVNAALKSINMSMDDWQPRWPFDFGAEYKAGTTADYAAMKANAFGGFSKTSL